MKQTITTQCKLTSQHHIRLCGLILLFLLAGLVGLQAQKVAWTSGYPSLSPTTLTALGDPGYLDVYFTPTEANIANAKLEITLPTGVNYSGIENGTGHTASITYDAPLVSGQTVTVNFNSNGNALLSGQVVFLRLKVTADCSATSASAEVKVLSGSTLITDGKQNVSLGVQIPTIRIQSSTTTISYSTQTDVKEFELTLDAQNGEASSFILILTTDQYSTLGNFSFEGASITPTSLNVISGNNRVTTLTLTTVNMGGAKLGTVSKSLKFKAGSTRCGARTISTSAQYSSTVNCNTQAGVTLTMNFPSVAGLPKIDVLTASYYDAIDGTAYPTISTVPKNLTVQYLKVDFKNNGTADAYNLLVGDFGMRSERCAFGFIDEKNIQYRIDSNPLQTIPASMSVGSAYVGNNSIAGYVKPEYANKFIRSSVTLPEMLPVGSTVTYWIPVYLGVIYDNGDNNVFMDYWTMALWGASANGVYCENLCGETTVNTGPYSFTNSTHFREVPSQMIVKSGDLVTQKIRMATATSTNPADYAIAELVIEMPDWMELATGNPETDIEVLNGSGVNAGAILASTGTTQNSGGIIRYSVQFSNINDGSSILRVKYKAGACQNSTANQVGKIGYHINWQCGAPSASNPPFTNSSQVFQEVTMLCKKDGVQLDDFKVIRTTRGLTDDNDNGDPDDGSIALGTNVHDELYLLDHEGYLKWDATILGTSADTYVHWYAPAVLPNFTLAYLVPKGGNATVSINGNSEIPVSYTQVNDTLFYLHYDAGATPLKGGDKMVIKLPFVAKQATNVLCEVISECFVSNVAFPDPFNSIGNVNRHGEDVANLTLGILSDAIWNAIDEGLYYFPDNNLYSNSYQGYMSYFNLPFSFTNEIMRKYYPVSVKFEVPEGYRYVGNMDIQYGPHDLIPSSATVSVAPSISGNSYTYSIASYFDLSYTGPEGTLPAGKFMIPDDYWAISFWPSVQAGRDAKQGPSPMKRTIVLKNINDGSEISMDSHTNYSYSGMSLTLNLSESTLPAYGPNMNIPVVTIGNPSASALNKMWLYVEGNVNNLSISPTAGGATIASGTGYQGRWIEVSNATMPSGATWSYQLNFTYGGSNDCSVADKVKVYTVSGFEDPTWAPASVTGSAINLNDIMHNGARKELSITAAPATITGKLETSTQTVAFNTGYTMSATLDSRSSEGSVKEASMTITLPAGQLYTVGSATVEYPLGVTKTASVDYPAIEAALVASNGNITIDRTVTVTSPTLLPGYLAAASDNDRQMVIRAEFKPQCTTVLTGFNYNGVLAGKTACGDNASGNGSKVFTPLIFTNVVSNYNFIVSTVMKSGNEAFNENRTSDILQVTLNKQSGIGIDMLTTDKLIIRIPEAFNINGVASIPSGFGASSITTINNAVVAGEREIELSLPVATFNADANKGIGQNMVFEIPLTYTPNAQTLAATPEQIIHATVSTNGKFDASCPDALIAVGSNSLNIAVVTSSENPFMVCKNSAVNLDVTSTGFGGSWYVENNAITLLGTGTTYSYTPTVQQDTVFYVSAVFNSVNYGMVPVNVQMYPEATITITAPSAICLGSSVNLSSGIVSGTPSGSTVKYYSDAAATTELTGADLTVSPLTATTYYAQVTTTQGCKSLPTAILVSVNPLPVITLVTDKTDDKVCIDTDITFTTESAMTNYVWNLGGATVTTSGGTSTTNTAVLQWNTSGTKTVTVNYTDANGCTATAAKSKSITVMPATVITTQPAVDPAIKLSNGYIIPGSNVSLNVVAATGPTLTYQWYWKKLSDGTVVTLSDAGKYSGTTSSTLLISNAYEEENGDYYVTVTGCGTTTSAPVTVIAVANQDASLKDLKIDGTTLWDFNPAVTSYMTTVVCAQEQVTILGIPNNPNYTSLTGNGTFQLAPGDNLFTITVVAQDMVTTMTYTVNVIRDCYIPKILKDLEDAVICVGDTHTFEIDVQGENLTYEWYYGLNRIMGANTNSLTISDAVLGDYERYYVVIRSHYNGFKSSAFSKKVRLWVADQLPTHLKFSDYPNPAITGNTYHIKVDGYTDVTKYTWSYDKEGVSFSPGADLKWGNEAWGTFGTLSAGNGILRVTMEHPCGTRELILPISVKYPTGTDDVTATTVQVYPNPTSGIVKVSNTQANQTIRISDVTGSLKGSYKTIEGTTTIDLTGYAKGTYIVQCNGKTYKVIKK